MVMAYSSQSEHGRQNVRFYKNEIPSQPHDVKIEEILDFWHGDYDTLEIKHGYIQWLFPTKDRGLNSNARPLECHELEEITTDDNALKRFERAFELILDFYGFQLKTDTGPPEIVPSANYKERFENMMRYTHNNLRITRILHCLREFSRFDFQELFIKALAREIYETKALAACRSTFENYWLGTVYDREMKQLVLSYAASVVSKSCENKKVVNKHSSK